jgi:glycosyltransferase involved in cell wall biosynthesis
VRRVLMVCYYFPPLGGIGSLRAAQFATLLPEFGWDTSVLAPKQGFYFRDPDLQFDERRVTRTGSLELSRLLRRAAGAGEDVTTPAQVGGLRARLRQWVHRWVYRPDGQIGWYPFAVAGGRAALTARRCDAIFSSSFPITAHLVARRLSRDFNLPWIAEFRDPWTDALGPDDSRRPAFTKLERTLVETAAAVVAPSPSWGDLFRAEGARRVEVITNGCDDASVDSPPPGPAAFVYVGTYYPENQDMSSLWPALAELRSAGRLGNMRLRFVGVLPQQLRQEIAAFGLGDRVEATGFVPHQQALAEMGSAVALLAAGSTRARPRSEGVIPAKLFEYLASQRPVIYVGDAHTDAAALLAGQPGCHVVPPGDVVAAKRAIEACIGATPFHRDVSQFTRRVLTRRLAVLLDRVAQ